MSVTTKRTTTRKAAPAANAVEAPKRISLGTAWETKNESFFAGNIQAADGRYANQSEFLELLGEPEAGFHWRIKLFVKELKNGKTIVDVVAEQEPLPAK